MYLTIPICLIKNWRHDRLAQLEWRLDPASDARLPWADGYDLRPIVICNEGATSSLAAAALQDLGLGRATDVIGGYRAWQAAGLPTARPEACTAVLAPGAGPACPVIECRLGAGEESD